MIEADASIRHQAEGKLEAWPEAELAIFALIPRRFRGGAGDREDSFKGAWSAAAKAQCCFAIPSDSQQEVNRGAGLVDCAIQALYAPLTLI